MNIDKAISIRCSGHTNKSIHDLHGLQGDLKTLKKEHLDKIKQSLISDGLPLALHVWIDKHDKVWIIDGHTRVTALKSLESEGYFIPPIPVIPIDAKNKKEAAKAILIASSRYSRMDETSLSNFMIEMDLQLPEIELLDLIDIDMGQFDLDNDNSESSLDDSPYTDKIASPIYTPKGDKPNINELFNISKQQELINKINNSNVTDEQKTFLIAAAQRHIVFNYQNIAEYYAHADKELQSLMEDSALVIIDYNKAVENGFVKLKKEINENFLNDTDDDSEEEVI